MTWHVFFKYLAMGVVGWLTIAIIVSVTYSLIMEALKGVNGKEGD